MTCNDSLPCAQEQGGTACCAPAPDASISAAQIFKFLHDDAWFAWVTCRHGAVYWVQQPFPTQREALRAADAQRAEMQCSDAACGRYKTVAQDRYRDGGAASVEGC